MSPIQQQLRSALGDAGDDIVTDYVVACLEEEEFDPGPMGSEALATFGEMLVQAGVCADFDAASAACQQLAALLGRSPARPADATQGFRALGNGPKTMADLGGQVHFSDKPDVRRMIQTPLGDMANASATVASERDAIKARKREVKEAAAAVAAMQEQQAAVEQARGDSGPVVVRGAGGGGARDLHLDNFSVSNGGAELIVDATVTLAAGRRYGLVGRNGAGKSTLLRAMAAHALPGIPATCQILHVEQEVAGSDTTALDTVLAADVERAQLLEQEAALMRALGAGGDEPGEKGSEAPVASSADATTQLEQVQRRLHEIDAHEAEAKAATILAGLSFSPEMQRKATSTFSGGWRMRIALARALFVQPDLLLLDEPTNHLDLHAVLWLEEYLTSWPGTVLVVSHAREFLNAVCTDVIHLHSRKLLTYRGNFSTFQKTLAERVRNQAKAAESVAARKAHMQAFIDKFRFNAKRASLVQSRIKAVEKMADVAMFEADPAYQFTFPSPTDAPGPPIISFTDVSFRYPAGPTLFSGLNFGLDLDTRAAVVGPNGIGKSTLLKLVSGALTPTEGAVGRNPRVRIAVFSQHHVDGLELTLNPLRYLAKCFPSVKEQLLRSHLGSFGVSGDLALQPMYTLSGGQKSRVAFAKVTFTKPHILLLDEPSNHLDIEAVDALVEGLNTFTGGVLMVSHDQALIEATVDVLWAVEGGSLNVFAGSFSDYKQRLRTMRKQ